jgi:hypothetical protein
MNFWITLWAVLIALYVMEEVNRYRQARERHKIYCHKEAIKYDWMTKMMYAAGRDEAAKQYAKQSQQWAKWSKSWIPTSPTQEEQDAEVEQSQDDAIREAIKDFQTQYDKQQADKEREFYAKGQTTGNDK